MDLDGLLTRSHHLGYHAVIYETQVDKKTSCSKPINMCNIDERLFVSNLPQNNTAKYGNIDDFAKKM